MKLEELPTRRDQTGNLFCIARLDALMRSGHRYEEVSRLANIRQESIVTGLPESSNEVVLSVDQANASLARQSRDSGIDSSAGDIPINCFDVPKVTPNQSDLYTWVSRNQEVLAARALQAIFTEYQANINGICQLFDLGVGERPFLPPAQDPSTIEGLCRPSILFLDPNRDAIGIWYKCVWSPVQPMAVAIVDRAKYYSCSPHAAIINMTDIDEFEWD
jgi:hypothetical protein